MIHEPNVNAVQVLLQLELLYQQGILSLNIMILEDPNQIWTNLVFFKLLERSSWILDFNAAVVTFENTCSLSVVGI